MRRPKLVFVLSLFPALAAVAVSAQTTPEISFCPAGVHADGFINWSKLPKAPAAAIGQQISITQTVPVTGIANLTATISIQGTLSNPGNSFYTVMNAADLFISTAGGTPVTITFSTPVKGFSVVFRSYGRSNHGFHMMANDVNGNSTSVAPPPPAQVDADGFEYPADELSTAPLQISSTSANLTSAAFGFDGDFSENFSFELVNLRVQSGSAPDGSSQVPLNGLTAWYRADKTGASLPPSASGPVNVSAWPDQSGSGNNASVPASGSGPVSTLDGGNCTPVLSFNGSQSLNFNLPVDGWTGMTVILASQAYADGTGSSNAALFWSQNEGWGETFVSPFQTSVWYRFGTGHPGHQPNYSRPANIGGDFSITTTVHTTTLDSLYVNGTLAQQEGAESAQILGSAITGSIGSGHGNTFFTGNIGEILIYNRALSDTERENVEHYLIGKYGVN
ncbi:MAG: LamG-like jellyroll fold domain-containing protein [Bryobacteraceae bacterium]